MAYNTFTYGVISQVAEKIFDEQPRHRRKANTVVVAGGALIAAALAALTFLLESGMEWVPSWAPMAVTMLTWAGTIVGVSKTRNGVTPSILQTINDTIMDLIDQKAEQSPPATGLPGSTVPAVETKPILPLGGSSGSIADELDDLARRYAERR